MTTGVVSHRVARMLAVLCLALAQWGCMGACDLVVPMRRLPAGYALVRFEGSFSVTKQDSPSVTHGGLLQRIKALGWSERHIVAQRSDAQAGWMIIDTQTGGIRGPLTDGQFAEAQKHDAGLRALGIRSVEDAWKELR